MYACFFLFKSPISQSIERRFEKIDEILAYIGGLFGTVAICLFIVSVYNGYSFEINLAGYLYKKDDPSSNTYKGYNFLYFLLHMFSNFLDNFNCRPNWKKVNKYASCREEMLKQLDVLYLLKRVTFTERALTVLLAQHQLRGLHLTERPTLE